MRRRLTFAAFSDISIVMSMPSSSARGFCLTTVARTGRLVENRRRCEVRELRDTCVVRGCGCIPGVWASNVARGGTGVEADVARHCWKKAEGVYCRVLRRGTLTHRSVGSDIVGIVFVSLDVRVKGEQK